MLCLRFIQCINTLTNFVLLISINMNKIMNLHKLWWFIMINDLFFLESHKCFTILLFHKLLLCHLNILYLLLVIKDKFTYVIVFYQTALLSINFHNCPCSHMPVVWKVSHIESILHSAFGSSWWVFKVDGVLISLIIHCMCSVCFLDLVQL